MKTTARRRSVRPIALAASLLTGMLVLFAPLSASAHDVLLSSSPEADSTVETLPGELTLTFSNKLIDGDGATEILVTDAAGTAVSTGPATVNGAIVTQPLVDQAEAGAYRVVWKIVSSDGHPTSGEFSFTVSTSTVAETPSSTPTPEATVMPETVEPSAVPSQAPSEADAVGPWLLAIVGVLVVIGVIVALLSRRGRRGTAGVRGTDDGSSGTSGDASGR